jgi:hypothetical protein
VTVSVCVPTPGKKTVCELEDTSPDGPPAGITLGGCSKGGPSLGSGPLGRPALGSCAFPAVGARFAAAKGIFPAGPEAFNTKVHIMINNNTFKTGELLIVRSKLQHICKLSLHAGAMLTCGFD